MHLKTWPSNIVNSKKLAKRANKKERDFDKHMRTSIQSFIVGKNQIKLSSDFTSRTMARIRRAYLLHKIKSNTAIIALIFSPFLFRAVWLILRNDYFAMGNLPFSQIIGVAYLFFLSSLASYVFLGIGTTLAVTYFFGSNIVSTTTSTFSMLSKTAGNIFNQVRYRV